MLESITYYNFSNFQEDIFLEFLIELKKRILEPAKLIELIDITASSFPNLLKIGDSDEDTYKWIEKEQPNYQLIEAIVLKYDGISSTSIAFLYNERTHCKNPLNEFIIEHIINFLSLIIIL